MRHRRVITGQSSGVDQPDIPDSQELSESTSTDEMAPDVRGRVRGEITEAIERRSRSAAAARAMLSTAAGEQLVDLMVEDVMSTAYRLWLSTHWRP